jgi:hypothetical protein
MRHSPRLVRYVCAGALAFANLAAKARATPFALNDVTLLLPLPERAADPMLLSPATQARGGALLPSDLLALLPRLAPAGEVGVEALRVVGLRLDPCFPAPDPVPPAACRPQLRLVWQPLAEGPEGATAVDAAVHTFYELSASELKALAQDVAQARDRDGVPVDGLALAVHPAVAAQGLGGAYWRSLRALVLRYAGAANLSRMTFTTVETPGQMWDFGGFDRVGGRTTRLTIARVGTRLQSFLDTATGASFRGGARPGPTGEGTLAPLLESSERERQATPARLREFADAAHASENPQRTNPDTLDCVSCHVAQAARWWLTENFPALGLDQSPARFYTGLPTANPSARPDDPTSVRAFGYRGRDVAVSQRVIHESALVAEALTRAFGL